MKQTDQNGFAPLLVVLILAVASIASFVGWKVYQNSTKPDKQLDAHTQIYNQVLSEAETIALINGCKLDSIAKLNDGKVNFRYEDDGDGKPTTRPHYAESSGYAKYVEAVKTVQNKCTHQITYSNHQLDEADDPNWKGDSWITREKAIELVATCKVDFVLFNTGPNKPELHKEDVKPTSGVETNYALREGDNNSNGSLYIYNYGESDIAIGESASSSLQRCGIEIETSLIKN